MNHIYQLTGMTCSGCEAKVTSTLLAVPGITSVKPSKEENTVALTMDQHVSLTTLQEALGGKDSKYQIAAVSHNESAEELKSWWQTYKPIVLIFSYITVLSILASWQQGTLHLMSFMTVFMSGFFLTFSFFKMLDLKSFAESYAMYDIVAKKIPSWGYVYAFIELALGLAYAANSSPLLINWITLVVMTVSIIGVLQSVFNKQKIRCACLGAVFNLPMSTVTIVEDAVMIAMSALMLWML